MFFHNVFLYLVLWWRTLSNMLVRQKLTFQYASCLYTTNFGDLSIRYVSLNGFLFFMSEFIMSQLHTVINKHTRNIQTTQDTNKPFTKVMSCQRGLWENEFLDGLLMCCVAWPAAPLSARLVLKWRAVCGPQSTHTALQIPGWM